VNSLSVGKAFGEVAILANDKQKIKRTASIIANE